MLPETEKELPLWEGASPFRSESGEEQKSTVTIYPALPWRKNRKAIVIFPGGGYGDHAEHEGRGYAEFLTAHGYCCFVVKYSLGSAGYRYPSQLADAARGVRYARSLAGIFDFRRDAIGVMGSSSGGHLAALLCNQYANAVYGENEDRSVSSRPDWSILCYPVISVVAPFGHIASCRHLLGTEDLPAELDSVLNNQNGVHAGTPPSFIWHTFEDRGVTAQNSLVYANALQKYGIPFELHIYEKGGHGKGLFQGHPWAEECLRWMTRF